MTRRAHSSATVRLDDGFTLVEVIVALAILALLLAMMPGAFGIGRRAWETTGRIEHAELKSAARQYIEQRLAEAMPVLVADGNGQRRPGFRGASQDLSFVAPSATGPAGGGLYHHVLTVEAVAGRPALVLRLAPITSPRAAVRDEQSRVLIDDVDGLRFRYFGQPAEDSERRWYDDWPQSERLPELVDLSPRPPDGKTVSTPFQPLVVALRLRRPR